MVGAGTLLPCSPACGARGCAHEGCAHEGCAPHLRELRAAEWRVARARVEGADALLEAEQALVDLGAVQTVVAVVGLRLRRPLRAGEVDHRQLAPQLGRLVRLRGGCVASPIPASFGVTTEADGAQFLTVAVKDHIKHVLQLIMQHALDPPIGAPTTTLVGITGDRRVG